MLKFKEKVAIVTGAGSGIGKSIAIELAKNGAKVVVVNRSEQNGLNTVKEIEAFGGTAILIQADISKVEDVKKYIKVTVDTFGRIDCLVNNAGIIGTREAIINYDEDIFSSVLDTNVKGTFYGLKYSIQEMMKTGGGSIVNVTAVIAKTPGANTLPTTVSRSAGMTLTKTMSKDLGKYNIRVNTVCIGLVRSGQIEGMWKKAMPDNTWEEYSAEVGKNIPLGRIGNTDEAANVITFLVSDAASYVTGTSVNIDGGSGGTL